MTTSVPMKIVGDCSVGGPLDGITEVPYSADEIAQRMIDQAAFVQQQIDAAAEQTRIDGLKASIAVKMGQTPQQGLNADELAFLARYIGPQTQ